MNPGIYNLGDRAITAALTGEVITDGVSAQSVEQEFIDRLGAMVACALFVNFTYGSGGTTCAVIVQTSLDGTNWVDVARFDFTTASASKRANLSALTPVAAGSVAALGSQGQLDGFLGDRLRAVVTSTGTYTGNTSVSVRAAVR